MIHSIPGNEWLSGLVWMKDANGFDVPTGKPLDGQAVVIWGGGPSFTGPVCALLRPYPAILCNNSYMRMPRSGIVVSLDSRWWGWHGNSIEARGDIPVTAMHAERPSPMVKGLMRMQRERKMVYSDERQVLAGTNTGHAAIHLAMHLGANTIYLAGFDMDFPSGKSHWHDDHLVPSSISNYEVRFKPALVELVGKAWDQGVVIAAITRTSAAIPSVSLETALEILELQYANRLDHAAARSAL